MTVVTGWDLFEDMRDAQDELLRFNRLRAQGLGQFGQYYGGGTAKAAWAPALDITERKDAYLVTVELPGVGIDDLEITFQDGLLTIQGERHDAHHSSEEMVHRVERRYGRFLRSITLPTHATRHQPSRAKPATDNAPTQGTDVSRRHRWTEPWRRESHAQAPAAGDSSRVRWAAATAMRCVPPRAAGYRRL